MIDCEKVNKEMFERAKEAEEDLRNVRAKQDGSFANKNLEAVFYGGQYDGKIVDHKELEKMGNGSFTVRFSALKVHNENLINLDLEDQPLVDGYLSPMLDGGRLRYETQEIYDLMFD